MFVVLILIFLSFSSLCSGLCSIPPDPNGHVSLPPSWTNISSKSFYECHALRSISIGDFVTYIGEAAFMYSNLSTIVLPSSMLRIEKRAFYHTKLTNVVIPASLLYLGDEAYGNNRMLSYVKVLSGNLTLGEDPFTNCENLTESQVEYSRNVFIKGYNEVPLIALQCVANTLSCGCIPGYGNEMSNTSNFVNCMPCGLGKSSGNVPAGFDACKECSKGKYADAEKLSVCKGCPAGKYGVQTGNVNESDCIECEVGTYLASSQGFSECKPCPPGNFCNTTGLMDYYACSLGTYQSEWRQGSCLLCPAGRYQDTLGGAICSACPAGKMNPQVGSLSASACTDCGSGKYINYEGADSCQKCPKDTYPAPSKQTCEACPNGKTTNGVTPDGIGASSCTIEKRPCSPGEERQLSTGICEVCIPGKYSHDGISCETCPISTYSDATAASSCTACPAGRYGLSSSSKSSVEGACALCPRGTFVDYTGASSCTACPPGSVCPRAGMVSAQPCAPGTYSEFSSLLNCTACPAGRYQSKQGAASCSLCGVGRYVDVTGSNGHNSCRECTAGRYASSNGSAICALCPVGHIQINWGQAMCLVCEDGKYSSADRVTCDVQDTAYSAKNAKTLHIMFGEGVALYGAFISALLFVVICALVEYIRDMNKDLGTQGYLRVLVKGFLTGFVFGAEIFIIYGMWSDSPPLGATILMFRLFHFFGALLVITSLLFPGSDAVRLQIGKVIRGAGELWSLLEQESMEDFPGWAVCLSIMSAFDLTMLSLLPWKASAFFSASGGLPTMGLFNFVFVIKTCQSTLAIIAEIAYIASYNNLRDFTTEGQAESLFGISIICLLVEVLFMVTTYVEYGDRLREIEKSVEENKVLQSLGKQESRRDYVPEPAMGTSTNNFDMEMKKIQSRMHENPMHQAREQRGRASSTV